MITRHSHLLPQYKYELFHVNFTSFHCTGRYELNKLTSLPMCGFIAQLVEHRTGIAEVTGSNPVEALIFSLSKSAILFFCIEMRRNGTENKAIPHSLHAYPCIQLARGKFELSNQDSTGEKNFTVRQVNEGFFFFNFFFNLFFFYQVNEC